jgi:hypothetical protein
VDGDDLTAPGGNGVNGKLGLAASGSGTGTWKKVVLVLCLAAGLWAGLFAGWARAATPTPDVRNGTLNGLPQADVNQIGMDVRRIFNIFFSVLGFVAAGFIAWNAVNLGRKDPRARQEAMAGLGYAIVGAILLFGTWFIISLASGFLNSGG